MYEELSYLVDCYFYQCWRDEHKTWQERINYFKHEEVSDEVEKLVKELQYIIDNNLAEKAIAETGRFVTPFAMDGLSAHDWCIGVLKILKGDIC